MLRRNLIANYVGSLYTILIGIIILPLYLNYLGPEGYGLIAFFTIIQTWMSILDVGLTPTLGRSVAVARTQESGFVSFIKLLRSLEIIFFIISVIIFFLVLLLNKFVATEWFNAEQLEVTTITFCITLMGGIVGVRWISGLYRSGITGMEHQVWLNANNILFTSIKYFGTLAYMHFISTDVKAFFIIQFLIVLTEFFTLHKKLYSLMPRDLKCSLKIYWIELKKVLPFALGIAYTTWLWIAVSQLDKLLLSTYLSLSDFGFYALIAVVAGAIGQLSGPVKAAILPKMVMSLQSGEVASFKKIYLISSQFVCMFVFSVASNMSAFGYEVLYIWTGNVDLSNWGQQIIIWLVLGNAILAIEALMYHMQFAHGKLKLHSIGSTISGLIQIPIIYFSIIYYGAAGAAISWFLYRLAFFLIWSMVVHHYFAPGFYCLWVRPLFIIIFVSLSTAFGFSLIYELSGNRVIALIEVLFFGLINLVISGMSAPELRKYLRQKVFQ